MSVIIRTMKVGVPFGLLSFVLGSFFSGACSDNSASMADSDASAMADSDASAMADGDGSAMADSDGSAISGNPDSEDSGAADGDASLVPPSARKRAFYFNNGTLGKIRDSADKRPALDVADEACTKGANQMGLGGSWKAWLSSSQVDAIDRILDVSPWYRVDRTTLLFETKAELTLGPRAPIAPREASDLFFWSGTQLNGRRTQDNCQDWTVYNLPAVATVGRANATRDAWVVSDPRLCSWYLALLCFEQ